MTPTEITKVIDGVSAALKEPLREEVAREIATRIDNYRRAIWVREEWCCNVMREFALKFWNAPKPRNDEMWGVQYQIRGHAVNYCPFCGAFMGGAKS